MNKLNPNTLEISRLKSGKLSIALKDGTVREDVHFTGLFPLRDSERSICVSHGKGHDWEEIGIIERMDQLPRKQRELVEQDLAMCYFLPEITDVKKVVIVRGLQEWHVATDRGDKVFYIMGRKENVILTRDGLILITDMDKCRYRITDYERLSPEACLHVERVMP